MFASATEIPEPRSPDHPCGGPPMGFALLNELRNRQDGRFLESRRDDLQGRPEGRHGLACRNAPSRQAHQRDEKRRRDPVDIVLELASLISFGKFIVTGYGRTGAIGVGKTSYWSNSSRKRWNTCWRVSARRWRDRVP